MDFFKNAVNWASSPTVLFTAATLGFALSLKYTQVWSKKAAYVLFAVMGAFYFLSMFDPNFFLIVAKPDNVPITFVLFMVAFFTWYAMHQGVENDKRIVVTCLAIGHHVDEFIDAFFDSVADGYL